MEASVKASEAIEKFASEGSAFISDLRDYTKAQSEKLDKFIADQPAVLAGVLAQFLPRIKNDWLLCTAINRI